MADVVVLGGPPASHVRSGGLWRALPVTALAAGSLALAMSVIGVVGLLVFMYGQPGPYLMPMSIVDIMMSFSSLDFTVYLPIAAVGLIAGIAGLWSTSHRRLAVVGLALTVASVVLTVPVMYVAVALI